MAKVELRIDDQLVLLQHDIIGELTIWLDKEQIHRRILHK